MMSWFSRASDAVRLRGYLIVGVGLTTVYVVDRGPVGRMAFAMISGATCVAIVAGLRRHRPSAVAGWYLLAVAMVLFTAAGFVQFYYVLVFDRLAPAESLESVASVSAYMFLIVGFGTLIKRRVAPTKETLLDVLIVVVGVGSAIGLLIIAPVLGLPGLTLADRLIAVIYPVADVLLLALLSVFFFARRGGSVALTLLVFAAMSALAVDTTAALSIQLNAASLLHWIVIGYAIALMAFGSAAMHPSMVTLSERPPRITAMQATTARLASLGLALMAGPAELSVQYYVQHRRPDFWVFCVVTAIIVAAALVRMRYLLKDVQDREERFRSMVQNSSDLILVCDPSGTLTYVSPSSKELLGYESEQMTGTSLFDLIELDDRERVVQLVGSLHSRRSIRSVPFEIRHANGGYRSVEAHFANLLSNKAVGGFFVNLYDTTERTALENELRHAQKLESVGQLASGIAHEINTPIQFVGDNVRFLEDAFHTLLSGDDKQADPADVEFYAAEIPQAIQQTLDGVDRVAEIVRAMKAFGHPGSEEKTFSDLNEAVRNSLVVTSNAVKQYARVETDLGELPLIRCHIGDVNQVLVNLFINAGHAVADQGRDTLGTITVRTRRDGNDAVIEVADTGTGIPAEIADRIFEPFFTTKEVGRGTGQGLALAYTLIKDRHGGSITFKSSPGRGTTFVVRLPVDSEPLVGVGVGVSAPSATRTVSAEGALCLE